MFPLREAGAEPLSTKEDNRMFSRLSLFSVSLIFGLGGLSACGVGPGPDLAGPQGPSVMAAYSGDWVLLRLESDDMEAKFQEAMAGRPGASAGGMPGAGVPGGGGGGMTGGRSGGMTGGRSGGMTGGRRGGMVPGGGGALDPEEMRRRMQATQAISRTPVELTLTLRPETATFAALNSAGLALPLDGEEQTITQGEVEYFAGATWTEEGLVIQRKVDGGGGVKDKIHVDEDGRLVVEREIDALRGGKVKGTLLYKRKEG